MDTAWFSARYLRATILPFALTLVVATRASSASASEPQDGASLAAQQSADLTQSTPLAKQPQKSPGVTPVKRTRFLFPLFSDSARARGFNLPLPWGVGVNYMFMQQPITLDRIALSANDNTPQETDFIKFGKNTSQVHAVTVRPDLWVLPFLNVYGIFGGARATTSVGITEPLAFESVVNQSASTAGFGLTGTIVLWKTFFSVDANFTWTKLEKLLEAVPGTVVSGRIGRNMNLGEERTLALWTGAMYQALAATTRGSIKLSDAIGQDTIDDISMAADAACDNSSRPRICHDVLDQISERAPDDTTVNYELDKNIKYPVNMLLGAQFGFSRAWFLRTEVGFIGRTSVLVSANYRFGIPLL